MANIFQNIGRLFGFGKKKEPVPAPPSTFGPKALTETPEGKLFVQTLRERLAGRGVGFRPGVISGATAPFAAQQRAGLQQQVLPRISAEASARGVGRSTIPVALAGQATAGVERDIASRVAELSLASEEQRRAEINAALAGIGGVARTDIGLRGAEAQRNLNEFLRQRGLATTERAELQAGTGRLVSTALGAIGGGFDGGGLAGAATGALGGFGGGATVNVGGKQAGTGDIVKIMRALGLIT